MTGFDAGSVRIYGYSSSKRTKLGQDIDGEAAYDYSGISVSLNSVGDRIAIGAWLNDGSGMYITIYIYIYVYVYVYVNILISYTIQY